MGPCMFAQVIGGPAWRRVFLARLSSGMTSLATTTSTSCGWLSLKRWQMRSLASSMPSTFASSVSRWIMRLLPPAMGFQVYWTDWAPYARSGSLKLSTPTLMTRGFVVSSSMTASLGSGRGESSLIS